MRAFVALFSAELRHFLRERMALFWMILFPVLLMLLLGFVFGGSEGSIKIKLGVVGNVNDPAVQGLITGLSQVPLISEIKTDSLEEELSALKGRRLDGVLVIPADLGSKLHGQENITFSLYYDASLITTRQVLISVLQEFLARSEEMLTRVVRRFSLSPVPIQIHRLRGIDYMVPGFVAMTLMQLGLFGIAGTLIAWRERKILRRFWAAPLKRSTFTAVFISHNLLISLVQAAIILSVGALVFHVTILGQYALMAGLTILGAITFISLGYLVASVARTVEGGNALLQMLNLPMMFLSGIFWPVEWMPGVLKPVVYALPLTYLGDALRQVMVEATPLVPLWLDVAVLSAWTLISSVAAAKSFRWE